MLHNVIFTTLTKAPSGIGSFSWNLNDLEGLSIRLLINIIVLYVIVRLLYYPKTKRKDYLFTYFLIGTITFFFVLA